ncbi:hypothetical protein GGR33_001132 [Methylobacterium brachythecii]|uniref:Uncharacterized protein n=1 Tax=Methylobacterium brachythecii TaxID=1176177 RepID=A0A7W6AG29_9HYPH|nr:hypothetical protein [Methylobacterium brachythecii]
MDSHTETADTVADVSSPTLLGLAVIGALVTVAIYWVLGS